VPFFPLRFSPWRRCFCSCALPSLNRLPIMSLEFFFLNSSHFLYLIRSYLLPSFCRPDYGTLSLPDSLIGAPGVLKFIIFPPPPVSRCRRRVRPSFPPTLDGSLPSSANRRSFLFFSPCNRATGSFGPLSSSLSFKDPHILPSRLRCFLEDV